MSEPILKVENLVKNYGSFCAVNNISFSIPKGKIIGLLGPNGAGKTTTIQILLSITLQNSGIIKYFGKDFAKERDYCLQRINFTSSFNTLVSRISVWENLLVFAKLYQVISPETKIQALAKYFEISDLLNQIYFNLSTGQKTRVNIVKSLLNDPELILMDEPTASLDPDITDKILSFIENLRESNDLSILYTSHEMDEVTRICDSVIFLDHGSIVAQDTPANLTKKIKNTLLKLVFESNKDDLEKILNRFDLSFNYEGHNTVLIKTEEKLIPKLISIISKDILFTDIEIKKPTLEDVFLQIARKDNNVS